MKVSLEEQVVAARERGPAPEFVGVSDDVLVEGFTREASAIAAHVTRRPEVRGR